MFCFWILHIIMKHTGSSRRISLIFDIFHIGVVTGYREGMLNLYSVYSASNIRRLCALLCPAISFLHFHVLHFQSVIFTSCNFMPCTLVRQFHVRHFHVLHFQRPPPRNRIVGLHAAVDRIGLSSFKFFWWAP